MIPNQYSVEKQSIVKHEEFELCYKLLKSIAGDDFTVYTSFSIFVSVQNISNSYYDEKFVIDITSSEVMAHHLFDLFSMGTVTPLTLTEVTEDMLAAF